MKSVLLERVRSGTVRSRVVHENSFSDEDRTSRKEEKR